MTEHGVRIALLARAGMARDQLHRALNEAGAEIVAEGDPADLDPKQVADCRPTVFLVSLEPSIEKALDKFDGLLAAPGIEVMFDDAEVTGKLDGWDLNRWARHVASKLLGSETLPPAPADAIFVEEGEVNLRPGLPPTPAELMDHAKLEDYTAETSELADWVPTSPSLTPAPGAAGAADASSETSFSWDGSQEAAGDGNEGEFSLDTDLGIEVDLGELDFAPTPDPVEPAKPEPAEPILGDMEFGESIRFSSFSQEQPEVLGDLDADVAQLAAQLEAFEKTDQRAAAVEPDFAKAPKEPSDVRDDADIVAVVSKKSVAEKKAAERAAEKAAPEPVAAPPAAASIDFSNLALAPMEGELPPTPPIVPAFSPARETPELQLGDLSLDTPAATAPVGLGAVLILAGLGGPDAVRQLLSSLPERLAVPVLLYQHLEVGKHERLVEQLAKISRLPVVLACDGAVPEPGKVTLLPAGMTAVANGNSLRFTSGSLSQLITALPAQDSMIIVLSGAEVQLVPLILAVKEEGGLVLAQDPEVCFDAAAADAMRHEGAPVFPALGLAKQISTRWPV